MSEPEFVLLLVILMILLVLINDQRLVCRFKKVRSINILAWVTVVILIILASILNTLFGCARTSWVVSDWLVIPGWW